MLDEKKITIFMTDGDFLLKFCLDENVNGEVEIFHLSQTKEGWKFIDDLGRKKYEDFLGKVMDILRNKKMIKMVKDETDRMTIKTSDFLSAELLNIARGE
jgi:hypothetical protein